MVNSLLVNLVSYYKCDENAANTTVDDVENTNEGTSSTNTSNLSVAGMINTGFEFVSANSEAVDVGATAFNFARTQAFSVSLWAKFTTNNAQVWIGNIGNLSHNTDGWCVFVANGLIYYQMNNGNAYQNNELQLSTTNAYNSGAWKHIVVTCSGSGTAAGVTFYVNGSSVAKNVADSDNLSGSLTYATNGHFGGCHGGVYADVIFDEIGVWDKCLSSTDVTNLYNAGAGLAYTSFDDGTLTVSPSAQALSFSLSSDTIIIEPTPSSVSGTLAVSDVTTSGIPFTASDGHIKLTPAQSKGTRTLKSSYPPTSALLGAVSKQEGRISNLVATNGSYVSRRNKKGIS